MIQAECSNAFVVDRIAWAEGVEVPLAAPETGDQQTATVITPTMTLAQVAAATGLGDDLLTGAADYQPARLWQMVTAHGVKCCLGDALAFYRVTSGNGTVVYEGMVPGSSSGGTDSITFGGSYGSVPLVLPAGDYSITAWLAPNSTGVVGSPRDECSAQVTLRPLDDAVLNADFPPNKACSFGPATLPSPGA